MLQKRLKNFAKYYLETINSEKFINEESFLFKSLVVIWNIYHKLNDMFGGLGGLI